MMIFAYSGKVKDLPQAMTTYTEGLKKALTKLESQANQNNK